MGVARSRDDSGGPKVHRPDVQRMPLGLPEPWKCMRNAEGYIVYRNMKTGEVRLDPPRLPKKNIQQLRGDGQEHALAVRLPFGNMAIEMRVDRGRQQQQQQQRQQHAARQAQRALPPVVQQGAPVNGWIAAFSEEVPFFLTVLSLNRGPQAPRANLAVYLTNDKHVQHGRYYYTNVSTYEMQWECPNDLLPEVIWVAPKLEQFTPSFTMTLSGANLITIMKWSLEYPRMVTGGDLFGKWEPNGCCDLSCAIGPGEDAVHSPNSFTQDEVFLIDTADRLVPSGAAHIGEHVYRYRVLLSILPPFK